LLAEKAKEKALIFIENIIFDKYEIRQGEN